MRDTERAGMQVGPGFFATPPVRNQKKPGQKKSTEKIFSALPKPIPRRAQSRTSGFQLFFKKKLGWAARDCLAGGKGGPCWRLRGELLWEGRALGRGGHVPNRTGRLRNRPARGPGSGRDVGALCVQDRGKGLKQPDGYTPATHVDRWRYGMGGDTSPRANNIIPCWFGGGVVWRPGASEA